MVYQMVIQMVKTMVTSTQMENQMEQQMELRMERQMEQIKRANNEKPITLQIINLFSWKKKRSFLCFIWIKNEIEKKNKYFFKCISD